MSKALSTLAVGDTIEVPVKTESQSFLGTRIVFRVADINHPGFPTGSYTLVTDKIITAGMYDNKEPLSSDQYRKTWGNSCYVQSNIFQWLNSQGAAGDWYAAQHDRDTPPYGYNESPGFLAMLDDNFVEALLSTTVTATPSNLDKNKVPYQVTAKMHLPSLREFGIVYYSENTYYYTDGTLMSLFNDKAYVQTYPTGEAVETAKRFGNPTFSTSLYCFYLTREVSTSNGYTVISMGDSMGQWLFSGYTAETLQGVRPFCNIDSQVLVTDSVNSNENYEFVWNQPPTISGTCESLDVLGESFPGYTYSITDPEGDSVSVVEKLDGVMLRTRSNISLGSSYTASITGMTWRKVLNGNHTLTITATDSVGNTATRTMTFTKSVTEMEAEMTEIFPADARPSKLLINAQMSIPTGAGFTVEICNNAHDTTPIWEDVSAAVNTGEIYIFNNTVKTAENWGVRLRFSGSRGNAGAACSISSIGGTFG